MLRSTAYVAVCSIWGKKFGWRIYVIRNQIGLTKGNVELTSYTYSPDYGNVCAVHRLAYYILTFALQLRKIRIKRSHGIRRSASWPEVVLLGPPFRDVVRIADRDFHLVEDVRRHLFSTDVCQTAQITCPGNELNLIRLWDIWICLLPCTTVHL
jgi:hypothetical protein